ncbi:erythromycin esterase [Saccharomonospora piscinae]|uniref:Erythromycin esterase n=1 Tax=Saccharomonospora piscinae TaxID=687388 RepID=A0A1V8ZX50_SACPI|nr:erythromycin esterase family protein [Saccharomonospora piscinae]OQO89378.1 erythromycin esterase [Saccharomonospora piscinae]
MTTAAPLGEIGRPFDDRASLGRTVREFLAARAEPPVLLALGEPVHGVEAFPSLRNDLLGELVERGYRSIVLETDAFAAAAVDDYVCGGAAELDTVLATGFSHGFGALPGNRVLVEWLRAYNAGRAPRDRVRFHGFDAPVEFAGAPSPRHALLSALGFLPAALRPGSPGSPGSSGSPGAAGDLDALVGEEAAWTNPSAMYEPEASIGDSAGARALRVVADDLVSVLRRAAPVLRPADPDAYGHAVAHARTARGLLRYHAAMADTGSDRIAALLSLRAEMMADNLLAIVERERPRGPSLVFAHNVHLRRTRSDMPVDGGDVSWCSAGALMGLELGERYVFVATDAVSGAEPGTLQHVLAESTTRRALFPAAGLRATLPASTGVSHPIARGHLPLTPAELTGADAVIAVADTDGSQHRYWEGP